MTSPESCAPAAARTFAGWVPTITGQLSFSLIGQGANALDYVAANVETLDAGASAVPVRHVFVVQRRVARDLPITNGVAQLLKPWIGVHFILVGSSAPASRPRLDLPLKRGGQYQVLHDEIGVLRGKIYVLGHHDGPSGRKSTHQFVQEVSKRVVAIESATPRGTICGDFDLREEFALVPDAAERAGVTLLECDFELYRSGEFRAHFDETSPVFQAAVDEASEDQVHAAKNLSEALAKQVYYFVKDISHRHYHHETSSDNILPAYEVRPGDDDSWRRQSLWALSRAVLEHRRRNVLVGHKRALGILAYAEAFQTQLACVRRISNGTGFEESEAGISFDFSHTRASLDATIDELSYAKSFWSSIQGVTIATVLGAAALWIGAVQIKSSACKIAAPNVCVEAAIPRWTSELIRQAIEHPALPFGALFASGLLWIAFSSRGLHNFGLLRDFRWLLGGWSAALGASTSRWLRKKHPSLGDTAGAIVAWVSSLATILGVVVTVAGFFSLLPILPEWLTLDGWLRGLLWVLNRAR